MKAKSDFHKRVVMGLELEGYTILKPDYSVSRKMAFHKGVAERGERFARDSSIGSEYNSRPFSTIREGFFLLKAGLRKYNTSLYRSKSASRQSRQFFLVGGWRDRFAGAHVHISIAGQKLTKPDAHRLAWHIHDHIPLIIAMTANSPVWADKLTPYASNRVMRGSKIYFKPIPRNRLTSRDFDEMTYSAGRKTKPPTLELRVMDSNIPEFIVAAVCVVKACALSLVRNHKTSNRISHYRYLKSRLDAARRGMKAKLCWNGEWVSAAEYLDRFVWTYREELKEMDLPQDVWTAFKLLKKGVNGSTIISEAAKKAYDEHPQTWQQRFAKRYTAAIDELLSGNSIFDFLSDLKVEAPNLKDTWLGREKLKLY